MENILTDENFEKEINALGRSPTGEATDKLVLVDFFAVWCEPCSILAPILEKAVKQLEDKVVLMKVNIDNAQATAQKFKVEKIPTVVLFKNGKPISGFVGLSSEQSIKSWLENIIK
jgi:thioredoxin